MDISPIQNASIQPLQQVLLTPMLHFSGQRLVQNCYSVMWYLEQSVQEVCLNTVPPDFQKLIMNLTRHSQQFHCRCTNVSRVNHNPFSSAYSQVRAQPYYPPEWLCRRLVLWYLEWSLASNWNRDQFFFSIKSFFDNKTTLVSMFVMLMLLLVFPFPPPIFLPVSMDA